ncbi:hypothetical protein QJS04_geneDACA018180 [Acorus gramineus]|uniref:Uncharacterized protein n=1 Tax=Acorus gramineus TaxID=55184 RepID=A0AAV9BTI8_ACOGR|nr:hypothetical protein QJS04_geneDACA018180 [Acorus gramineus]
MAKPSEGGDADWELHLRSISSNSRDSSSSTSDIASDPSILHSVKRLYDLCKEGKSEELIARVYPQLNKLFQRSVASLSQSRTPIGLLLLLQRPEGPTQVIERGKRLEKSFLKILPGMMSPGSFLPLFPALVDLPIVVVALEKVERSSGTLVGSSIDSIQKSTAPEMLLALMDEAYTGSTIEDRAEDSGSDDSSAIDVIDPLFLDLLKDENDGIAERHWSSPGITTALQAATSTPQSDRLKQALDMTPRFLDIYFDVALRDVNNSLICALISLLMSRNATIFPDRKFSFEVRKRLLEFILAAFHRSPDFIALLKKPIIDRLGEAYDSTAKVALSRISDTRVQKRARDYLGLMNDPTICFSVLGPSGSQDLGPGMVNWSEGSSKMVSHVPFYILNEQEVRQMPPIPINPGKDLRGSKLGPILSAKLN